jgi:hypothetical protein
LALHRHVARSAGHTGTSVSALGALSLAHHTRGRGKVAAPVNGQLLLVNATAADCCGSTPITSLPLCNTLVGGLPTQPACKARRTAC